MIRSLGLACVTFAVTTTLVAGAAFAQMPSTESSHLLSVGLGGGVSVPVSDAKDAFKNGFNGQGFVKLNLRGLPVTPRLDFTYQKFDLKSAKIANAGTGTALPTGTGTVLAGVANLQIPLLRGPVEPYIVAGLGAYNVKTEVDNATNNPGSKTQFGVNGGAGLLVRLGVISLYAEGRVDNVYTQKGVIDSKQIQVVPVSFGLIY